MIRIHLLSPAVTSFNASMIGLLVHHSLVLQENLLVVHHLVGLVQPLLIITVLFGWPLVLVFLGQL